MINNTSFSLTWTKASTSIHLDKQYVVVSMKTLTPSAMRILPTMSIPHLMNGYGDIIGCRGQAG